MTVTVYKSTDASAPTLTGQVGSLTTLLDAILVNGYGSKAAQGWTIAFTGTNTRDYLMPGGTNGRYLDVIDIGTGAATYARIVGYENMTAINTGTALFPTAAQLSGGLYVWKSITADAVARPWWAYGNGKIFFLFTGIDSNVSNPLMHGMAFGDFTSYVPGDTFNTIIIGATTSTSAYSSANNHQWAMGYGITTGAPVGHYICRNYTGIGSSVACTKFSNISLVGVQYTTGSVLSIGNWGINYAGNSPGLGSALAYPNNPDSGLYMERLWLGESNYVRGELPGIWTPLHTNPLVHLDTFSGTGALAGKTFDSLRIGNTLAVGNVFMETSNTW